MTKSTKLGLGILGGFCALVAGYYAFIREPAVPPASTSILDTLGGPNLAAGASAPLPLPLAGSSLTIDSTLPGPGAGAGQGSGGTLANAPGPGGSLGLSLESRAEVPSSAAPAGSASQANESPASGAIALVSTPGPVITPGPGSASGSASGNSGAVPSSASRPGATVQLPANPVTTTLRTHTVKAGDTLGDIAMAAYGKSSVWTEIVKANPLVDPNKLQVGQVIKLPDLGSSTSRTAASSSPTTQPAQPNFGVVTPRSSTTAVSNTPVPGATIYTVQEGDTLWSIAQKHYKDGGKWQTIFRANTSLLSNPDQVRFGMKLTIPPEPK